VPLERKNCNIPSSPLITLKTKGKIGDGIASRAYAGRTLIEADLHPAMGRKGDRNHFKIEGSMLGRLSTTR
jgi:hypothetical protein